MQRLKGLLCPSGRTVKVEAKVGDYGEPNFFNVFVGQDVDDETERTEIWNTVSSSQFYRDWVNHCNGPR